MQRIGFPADASEHQDRRRPRASPIIGALAGLAAFLAVLSLSGLSPSDQRLTDQALDVVSRLETALDADDVEAVMELLATEWAVLDLPGSVQQVLPVGSESDQLRLYVNTVDIDLAGCEAEGGSHPVTALVRCDASVFGDLPAALGHGGSADVVVGVHGDKIVSAFRNVHPDEASGRLNYCIWAEAGRPELAANAFDVGCHPRGDASVHNRLAAMYVAAGKPPPAAEELESRRSLGTVAAIEGSQHDPEALATVFSNDWPLVRYPGLLPTELRSPFPAVSEYLAWSDLVYEVELGQCDIAARLGNGGFRVECPEARWGGALVANLGLESVAQPVAFFVEEGSITGSVGTTGAALDSAVVGLCNWARRNQVDGAGIAFRDDCAPHYTPEGAAEIVTLAEEFTSGG